MSNFGFFWPIFAIILGARCFSDDLWHLCTISFSDMSTSCGIIKSLIDNCTNRQGHGLDAIFANCSKMYQRNWFLESVLMQNKWVFDNWIKRQFLPSVRQERIFLWYQVQSVITAFLLHSSQKRPYYIWIVTASSAQGPKNNYGGPSRTYKLLGPWAEARGQ